MRIAWYDHGQYFQSAAIPDLPPIEETWGVYGAKAHQHFHLDVVGMSMWRIPLLHRLLDDDHEVVMLTRRKVDPSPELDEDLSRLVEQYPEYDRYVRIPDPCLNRDQFLVWPVRTNLNAHYFDDQMLFAETEAPSSYMLRYWVREEVLGVIPDADVFVCAAMRADEATAFEMSYMIGVYLRRGTPVVIWDQDRQLSGVKAAFERLDDPWPHPLVTVIGPYEEETRHAKPLTIDYPYVELYERDPLPTADKRGAVYVGNDYGRREAMERLLLHLPHHHVPVAVYGRYEAKDGPTFMARHPNVDWAGRIPPNAVPGKVAAGHFTVNIVKKDYMDIGLLTLRTFDANVYGTLQIGDRRVKRLKKYVPDDYLVDSSADAVRVAKRIMGFSDREYAEELDRQRALTKTNDMNAFVARFYEIIDQAVSGSAAKERSQYPPLGQIGPATQHRPGVLCTDADERIKSGMKESVGWDPTWKARKDALKTK